MYSMIKNSFIFQTLNICTIFYITDVFVTFDHRTFKMLLFAFFLTVLAELSTCQ